MHILGIDYGKSKVGFSVSFSFLADPVSVFYYKDEKELFSHIGKLIDEYKVEKIVVGVSENKMAEETKEFAKKLEEVTQTEVETHDETLSSKDAQKLSQESGMKRKKRKEMEDAFAATLMLQDYLDSNLL